MMSSLNILKCKRHSIKWYLKTLLMIFTIMYVGLHVYFKIGPESKGVITKVAYVNRPSVDKRKPTYDGRKSDNKQQNHIVTSVSNLNASLGSTTKRKKTNFDHNKVFHIWEKSAKEICLDNKFVSYYNHFAYLKSVLVNPHKFIGPKGGEDMEKVMNQDENVEYLKFTPGCFQMECLKLNNKFKVVNFDSPNNHANGYFKNTLLHKNMKVQNATKVERFTIAVTRYEYVNIYHTMTDFYNAYLMMAFFNKTADETDILLVDAHPVGSLDSVWSTLFSSFSRVRHLPNVTYYSEMVWSPWGYFSPMYVTAKYGELPLSEEYRKFFLKSYGIDTDHRLDCKNINILFIWRRDYVAHPRNPTGLVHRKVKNEDEIILSLSKTFPYANVTGKQLDALPMKEQMSFIGKTDIFLGMHGAGLTLGCLTPKHGAMIEIFPQYVSSSNMHYEYISHWRKLHYQRWQNQNAKLELPNKYTVLPIDILENLIKKAIKGIGCSGNERV